MKRGYTPHAYKMLTTVQLFHGIERFYRAGYIGNLVQSWIPALDGVEAKFQAGI